MAIFAKSCFIPRCLVVHCTAMVYTLTLRLALQGENFKRAQRLPQCRAGVARTALGVRVNLSASCFFLASPAFSPADSSSLQLLRLLVFSLFLSLSLSLSLSLFFILLFSSRHWLTARLKATRFAILAWYLVFTN